jgi:dynein heavy chain
MEKVQRQTQIELAQLQETLKELSTEIGDLNAQYTSASNELDTLQMEAAAMTRQLNTASKLIDGLTGERSRWTIDISNLQDRTVKLVGDCLLGASFLSYLGAFTTEYRKLLMSDKFFNDIKNRGIPLSSPFLVEKLLTTDSTIQVRGFIICIIDTNKLNLF